jgi:hypothetical protein
LQNSELSALHAELERLFSSVSAEGNRFFGRSSIGISRCARNLENTGGFQPVGAVDLGHSGYETAAPCIID